MKFYFTIKNDDLGQNICTKKLYNLILAPLTISWTITERITLTSAGEKPTPMKQELTLMSI